MNGFHFTNCNSIIPNSFGPEIVSRTITCKRTESCRLGRKFPKLHKSPIENDNFGELDLDAKRWFRPKFCYF